MGARSLHPAAIVETTSYRVIVGSNLDFAIYIPLFINIQSGAYYITFLSKCKVRSHEEDYYGKKEEIN